MKRERNKMDKLSNKETKKVVGNKEGRAFYDLGEMLVRPSPSIIPACILSTEQRR